jgi:hypothetical protein
MGDPPKVGENSLSWGGKLALFTPPASDLSVGEGNILDELIVGPSFATTDLRSDALPPNTVDTTRQLHSAFSHQTSFGKPPKVGLQAIAP